jgi:retron-type reverse transcriptase
MHLLRSRIEDRKIASLIWQFLRAGVMEQGTFRPSVWGTPQGGSVSPLLANIPLHALDGSMARFTERSSRDRETRKRHQQADHREP